MPLLAVQQQPLPLSFPLQVVVRRLTCRGMQYSILDCNHAEYAVVEVVTISGDVARCTCGESECAHVRMAGEREEAYKAEAAKREVYCSLFSIHD